MERTKHDFSDSEGEIMGNSIFLFPLGSVQETDYGEGVLAGCLLTGISAE